jgi:hypothetical protein
VTSADSVYISDSFEEIEATITELCLASIRAAVINDDPVDLENDYFTA